MNEKRTYTKEEVLQSLQAALEPPKPPEGAICCEDIMKATGCKSSRALQIMRERVEEGWQELFILKKFNRVKYILPPDAKV